MIIFQAILVRKNNLCKNRKGITLRGLIILTLSMIILQTWNGSHKIWLWNMMAKVDVYAHHRELQSQLRSVYSVTLHRSVREMSLYLRMWENLDAARFAPLLIFYAPNLAFYAPNLAFYIVKQRAQKDRLATRQKVGIDREGPGILFLDLDDRITIRVLPNWKKSSAAWGNVSASAEKCEPRHDRCLTRVAALTAQHSTALQP